MLYAAMFFLSHEHKRRYDHQQGEYDHAPLGKGGNVVGVGAGVG